MTFAKKARRRLRRSLPPAALTMLRQLRSRVRSTVDALPRTVPVARRSRREIGGPGPIVSVVIPGKNEAAYVRDCIESLRNQTLANFEAVIVDDGSTDSTLDKVLEAIGDDVRFRVFRNASSMGAAIARNHGVAQSRGRYVTFLDLDDFLAPDALADRVELAERFADQPWVAGSYCGHELVDPDAHPATWRPANTGPRGTMSWLSPFEESPFIATTPLIRRDAFLSLGGFSPLSTGEDAAFWFTLLRSGFVVAGTGTTAAAYRLKPTSRAIETAVELRDVVTGLIRDRMLPSSPPAAPLGPFHYESGLETYRAMAGFARRTASALGQAVALGSQRAVVEGLVEDLRGVPYPLVGWEVNVRRQVTFGITRVTRARREQARDAELERVVDGLLAPIEAHARQQAARWLAATDRPALEGGSVAPRAVRIPKLVRVTEQSVGTYTRTGKPMLLLPSSAYHTDELIDFVDVARARGFEPVAMLSDRRWETTGSALARVDVAALSAIPAGDWLLDFDAIVSFNDWGEYYKEYILHVAGKGPVSFAKVEGVQDWLDHDTGRVRNAYLSADVILCQGENDVAALQGRRGRLEVVGSDRLEAIWNGPLPPTAEPRVVGNVNFTYGVQTEHRRLWVDTLREACRRAGVPLDLSLHPSETARLKEEAALEPIRHLMVTDSILVSRFSTVLFEGMARGCSVIYYNPHGERVPTFHDPRGAFDIANNEETLVRHLATAMTRTRAEAKARAAAFFERQVSMIPGVSVATRMADAIERNLAGTIG